MHQDIPNDIAVSIKDKLRGLRYALRHTLHGQNEAEKPAVLPEVVLNRAAHIAATVMDKAFSTAETISISLVSDNPSIHETAPDVQSLSFYFNGRPEGQRAFHRDMYYLTKAVLHRNKAENLLIQEAVFKTIYARIKQLHGAELSNLQNPAADIIQQSGGFCTTLFQEMLRQQPVRQSGNLSKSAMINGFAAIALACALATAKPVDMENIDNLESALLAVEAREDRIIESVSQNDSAALQKLFATLIFHLP